MRRYGTYQYGVTQYGEGAVTIPAVHDAVTFSDNLRTSRTRSVRFTSTIAFSDKLLSDVLRQAYMLDQIIVEDDIRLKYVRVTYEDSIQFAGNFADFDLLSVARVADSVLFSAAFDHVILMKNVSMSDDVMFSETVWVRHNWEPIPNPEDETWVPQVSATDLWVPKISPNETWMPREQNNG